LNKSSKSKSNCWLLVDLYLAISKNFRLRIKLFLQKTSNFANSPDWDFQERRHSLSPLFSLPCLQPITHSFNKFRFFDCKLYVELWHFGLIAQELSGASSSSVYKYIKWKVKLPQKHIYLYTYFIIITRSDLSPFPGKYPHYPEK